MTVNIDRFQDIRPHAQEFCAKSLAITLIVASIIGLVCGVLAYYVATGQSSLNAFASISESNSYFMMGGFAIIFVGAASLLAYFFKRS